MCVNQTRQRGIRSVEVKDQIEKKKKELGKHPGGIFYLWKWLRKTSLKRELDVSDVDDQPGQCLWVIILLYDQVLVNRGSWRAPKKVHST